MNIRSIGRSVFAMTIEPQLNQLFENWRTYLGPQAAAFVYDGIVGSEECWLSARPRILFLLKEPHDRNNVLAACRYDLRVLFRDSHRFPQNKKTVERRLACWAYDLRRAAGAPAPDPRRALLASAVINLRKLPGAASTRHKNLIDVAFREQSFILRQIEILDPQVVVCGGTFLVAQRSWGGFESIDQNGLCFARNSRLWFDHYHPAARARVDGRHANVLQSFLRNWGTGIGEASNA